MKQPVGLPPVWGVLKPIGARLLGFERDKSIILARMLEDECKDSCRKIMQHPAKEN